MFFLIAITPLVCAGCSDKPAEDDVPAVFHSAEVTEGDSVGQFVVREIQIDNTPGGDWSGFITFSGTIEISGRYGEHPAYPDTGVVCFFPDENSVKLLPRFVKDGRNGWFSFSNAEDDPLLAAMQNPKTGKARIIISDFFYSYAPSDVENSARLDEIIELEPEGIQ